MVELLYSVRHQLEVGDEIQDLKEGLLGSFQVIEREAPHKSIWMIRLLLKKEVDGDNVVPDQQDNLAHDFFIHSRENRLEDVRRGEDHV